MMQLELMFTVKRYSSITAVLFACELEMGGLLLYCSHTVIRSTNNLLTADTLEFVDCSPTVCRDVLVSSGAQTVGSSSSTGIICIILLGPKQL